MLLRTKYACPVCSKSDYTKVQSSCVVCCSCDPSSFASLLRQWRQISSSGLFVKDFVLRSVYEKGGWGEIGQPLLLFQKFALLRKYCVVVNFTKERQQQTNRLERKACLLHEMCL